MRAARMLPLLSACVLDGAADAPAVVVHAPAELAPGASLAVDDLVADLGRLTGAEVRRAELPAPPCRPGELHVLVLGHEHGEDGRRAATGLDAQAYAIDEQRCGSGHRVVVRGGSLLAGQWAVYDLLEHLGVRYFHPEQTLYPSAPRWPATPLAVHERPDLGRRSMHVHRTHPVELSPPIGPRGVAIDEHQRRWIGWNLRLRQTEVDGWDATLIGGYPYLRGFPRTGGFDLLNSQQGVRPVLDPDDPRPEPAQLTAAIDAAMAPIAGLPPLTRLGVQFNPSELTVADEAATVERLTFVTEYVQRRWPGVEVRTINHGTGQAPGPRHHMRFFDLPALAPPALAVQVHPLMFYDLDRPAPVYGNADNHFLRDWLVEQQAIRRVHYYPEASWWLTFDLPVPLFLAPVTLEARDHDLRRLRPYLAERPDAPTGVVGHHLFTSGEEWGYWLIDYCVARMTWDVDLGWLGCLDHVTEPFVGGATVRAVLEEVGRAQVAPLRDPEVLALLVGADDETEAAALAGLVLHPLPPPPARVPGGSDAETERLRATLARLTAMAGQYRAWADRIAAVIPRETSAHAPWLQELVDGLRITGLRAAHAVAIYEGALALRHAVRAGDPAAIAAVEGSVAAARAITADARAIVRAREAAYRYPPVLTIEGDEPGTPGAVPNQTIYPYRYLSRTHRLFYWTRPDDQLAAAIAGARARLAGGDRFPPVAHRLELARGTLKVTAPAGAALLDGLLPGLVLGLGHDTGGDFLAIAALDDPDAAVQRRPRTGASSAPADLEVALARVGRIVVRDAVIAVHDGRVTITGALASDDVVALLVATGGFEPVGARRIVATTLGFTAATLPDRIALRVEGAATVR